ncbi:hypothetical protein RJ639_009286 [Escallonia herrerae]|uniref:Uncharacterized protein n=1 Tax=Escallonia herrerae TaxID=1293975 RepID=A0AA89ATV9_9ASTE|nr:hypothetical protein RJ639_009286 [Escallonia herrerae]
MANPMQSYRESTPARAMQSYREWTPARSTDSYRESTVPSVHLNVSYSGCGGVCMMSNTWKDEQNPSFINFISCFLSANSFRLNFVPIAPVTTVLNSSSTLVQFITRALTSTTLFAGFYLQLWRVQKLKGQFAHLYVVVTLPTKEQNDSFVRSYFTYDLELGRPTFLPVQDLEMGFEKIVKIAHARGVCKRQDAISKLKAEREKSVQTMDRFLRVVTAIPGVDNHDANSALYLKGHGQYQNITHKM